MKKVVDFRWNWAGSESNSATLTFDGVDMMGERLANEVFLFSATLSVFICLVMFCFFFFFAGFVCY